MYHSLSSRQQDDLINDACILAAELLEAPKTTEEKNEATKMTRLLQDAESKELTFHLADEVFRPQSAKVQAAIFRRLIKDHGIPKYLKPHERLMMRIGAWTSLMIPELVMPAVTAQIRSQSERVILPAEDKPLNNYLQKRPRVTSTSLAKRSSVKTKQKDAFNKISPSSPNPSVHISPSKFQQSSHKSIYSTQKAPSP